MITTKNCTKEWYICRSFSFTSSTMLELMSVLSRYEVDWPEYQVVRRLYNKQENAQFEADQITLPSPTNPTTNLNPIDISHISTHSPLVRRQLFSAADLFNSSTISTSDSTNLTIISSNTTLMISYSQTSNDDTNPIESNLGVPIQQSKVPTVLFKAV